MNWYIIYLIIGIVIYFYFKYEKSQKKYEDLLCKTRYKEIGNLLESLKLNGNSFPVLDFYKKFFELYFYCYLISKNRYSESQNIDVYKIAYVHLFEYCMLIDKKFLIIDFELAIGFPLYPGNERPVKFQLHKQEFIYLRELEIFVEIAINESLKICSSKKAVKEFYSIINP